MEMITERRRLLGLQHQLTKRLTALMPNTIERKLIIPLLSKKVIVNYNSKLMKWFFYIDYPKEQKFTYFIGTWKYGVVPVAFNGTISVSWNGDDSHPCIFAKDGDKVALLHSGDVGAKVVTNFLENYEGETTTEVEGSDKKYAVIGRTTDEDYAEKIARFFDFLTA